MKQLLSNPVFQRRLLNAIALCAVGYVACDVLVHAVPALAQGIAIGGQDNSGQMKDVQNLMTTIQTIAFKWVARVIGGIMVVGGIYKIASRDFMSGIISTGAGGTLFFVEKIADSLSRMGGNV